MKNSWRTHIALFRFGPTMIRSSTGPSVVISLAGVTRRPATPSQRAGSNSVMGCCFTMRSMLLSYPFCGLDTSAPNLYVPAGIFVNHR